MEEETIAIGAKRLKPLANLASLMGSLGFTRIAYSQDQLVIEKTKGEDLRGQPNQEYRIRFMADRIEFAYSVPARSNKRSRLLHLLPVFIDVLKLSEDYYNMKPSSALSCFSGLLSDVADVVDKEALDLSAELRDLQARYESLNSRYQELVRSSEENTRILLECERKRDELTSRVRKMRGMGDDLLREELYAWLRTHNGSIDVREFASAHSIEVQRVEQGLEMLIRDGYIKRRLD